MKKDNKMQNKSTVKNCRSSKVTNSANTNRSNNVKNTVGFEKEDKSFELDENNDHSFELR